MAWGRRAGNIFQRQGGKPGSEWARQDHFSIDSEMLRALDQKEKIACFFVDSAGAEVYQPTSLVTEPCSNLATRASTLASTQASSRVARRDVGEAGSWQAPALVQRELEHRAPTIGTTRDAKRTQRSGRRDADAEMRTQRCRRQSRLTWHARFRLESFYESRLTTAHPANTMIRSDAGGRKRRSIFEN